MGDEHTVASSPSSEQKKVTPAWSEENWNVALALGAVAGGAAVIVVSGSATTVHAYVAGVSSVLPARSVATTRKVWLPGARSAYSSGDSHSASGSLSSEHSNVDSGSLDMNVKLAMVSIVVWAFGPIRIVVWGSVVSGGVMTVHVWLAGVASTFPARSMARTS